MVGSQNYNTGYNKKMAFLTIKGEAGFEDFILQDYHNIDGVEVTSYSYICFWNVTIVFGNSFIIFMNWIDIHVCTMIKSKHILTQYLYWNLKIFST